ncbi:MAG: VanZ family protein [Clostridia bacterium]|nr:VanZ family protein [Clostridia bacterium]
MKAVGAVSGGAAVATAGNVAVQEKGFTVKKDKSIEQFIIDGVCVLYILFLIYGLLFKFKGFEAIKKFNKGIEFTWNPRLGWATLSKYSLSAHLEVWGNLAIFIPLGCFFSINNKRCGLWHLLDIFVIMTFSAFIEISQAVFVIGMGDIRDIILNTAGGAIGIYLYKLLNKIFKNVSDVVFLSVVAVCMIGFTWAAFTYMDGGFK